MLHRGYFDDTVKIQKTMKTEIKDKVIRVRCEEILFDYIEERSEILGMTMSNYIRSLIRDDLAKEDYDVVSYSMDEIQYIWDNCFKKCPTCGCETEFDDIVSLRFHFRCKACNERLLPDEIFKAVTPKQWQTNDD